MVITSAMQALNCTDEGVEHRHPVSAILGGEGKTLLREYSMVSELPRR